MTTMKRVMFVVGMVCGGCTVDGGDTPGEPPPGGGPAIESRYCEQTYELTGTFAPGTPARDANTPTGCWPVGTWQFVATLDPTREVGDYNNDGKADRCGEVAGTANPQMSNVYSFRVDRTTDEQGYVDTYTYTGSHTTPEIRIEVNGDGGGECEGDLSLIDGDKVLTFKAAQTARVITGYAEYASGEKPNTF
jgi:hypothetical protein